MQRLEDVESEEYAAALNQLKEEIQAGRVQIRSAVERANRLAELLESQKQELAAIKQIIASQEIQISQLNAKLNNQQPAQDKPIREERTASASPVKTLPRSLSFSAINPVITKNESVTKPRSGSDLTKSISSLFLFKNPLKGSSPRDSFITNKPENEISPRVHFLNVNLRPDVNPAKERPVVIAKEKKHTAEDKPVTKYSIDFLFSQARSTGRITETLKKNPESQYLNAQNLVKRNLTIKI